MKQNPAIKILGFFEDMANSKTNQVLLKTVNATNASHTLANMQAVQDSWTENWMKQWAF